MREVSDDLQIGTTPANFSSEENIPSDIEELIKYVSVSIYPSTHLFARKVGISSQSELELFNE